VNKKLLILSGPTHEYIDPVRYIGNASSGKMGAAIAEAAVRVGWIVDFISGPVHPSSLPDLQQNGSIHHVTSAEEMLASATLLFPSVQAAVFAAAVADFKPKQKIGHKMDHPDETFELQLRPTVDIAASLGHHKRSNQKCIGFALQTHDSLQKAREKLSHKNLDAIIINDPTAIGADQATYQWLDSDFTSHQHWGNLNKNECAERIIQCLTDWSNVT
jgi:phosphopantothenoylcysteine decarboxylase/phosphopantothenate--cysteine ligase